MANERAVGTGRTCIFDIEGDNLLDKVTKLHSSVAIDVNTRELFSWRPWQFEEGLKFLAECECLIGHNILDYDFRAIEKLHPGWVRPAKAWDTLIFVKVIWPADTLWGRDMKLRDRGIMPPFLIKSHGLKAWGLRLGEHKAEYTGGWDVWSEEMHAYMEQDAWANLKLWEAIKSAIGWTDPKEGQYVWPELPFEIEHGCQRIILEQTARGYSFDKVRAVRFSQDLRNTQADLEQEIAQHFQAWWEAQDDPEIGHTPKADRKVKLTGWPDVTIPRVSKAGKPLAPYVGPPFEHFSEGASYVRIKRVAFQPGSRDHLGQRLQAVYGWKPTAFGKDGKPTVDEATIKAIPEAVLPETLRRLLLDYFTVTKTLGQLSVGRKSWLNSVRDDGKIHGRMNTCGAITGRGIHMDPNLGQVPAAETDKSGKVLKGIEGHFGWDCRRLFGPSAGLEQTGTDASSLELLVLGHYLHPFDNGQFCDRVSDPTRDPHTEHAAITGLNRDDTKTVTYLSIYGGGAGRAAEELEVEEDEVPQWLKYKHLPALLKRAKSMAGSTWVEPTDRELALLAKGHKVIKDFEAGIPGWKDCKEQVTQAAIQRRWLKGLDGRKLYVRKAHAALNTLLQGGGAIICKLWMIIMHRMLAERGIGFMVIDHLYGTEFDHGTAVAPFVMGDPNNVVAQVLWVHDELQFEHTAGLGPLIGELSDAAIKEAGHVLNFRGVLRTDFKTGRNWAETH